MNLQQKDILWTLDDVRDFHSQEDLYDHLDVSDHLKDAIFRPPELEKRGDEAKTQILGKRFDRVSFSKTEISGITFKNCIFENCLFVASSIKHCEFHGCKFILTNTYKISISDTYLDPISFTQCLLPKKHQNIGVGLYQSLLRNSRKTEQIEFERDAHFLFLRWKRFQDAYEIVSWWKTGMLTSQPFQFSRKCLKYVRRLAWEKFFGSGLKIRYFVVTLFVVIVALSTLNYIFRANFGLMQENEAIVSFWDALYFTTISVTTLGYGDITPTTLAGRIVATAQSIIGFCMFAVFASMLFRRISP